MASNFYTIGGTTYRRNKKQGAPGKPDELKRRNAIIIRLTDAELEEYKQAMSKSFLKSSAFGALVISAGISKLFESNKR